MATSTSIESQSQAPSESAAISRQFTPRVLLVTEAANAGVGRHVLDLAQGLAERGCKVACVYSPRRADRQFLERSKTIHGVTWRELDMRRSVQPADSLAAWRLARLARSLGPFDILHGHSSKGGALVRLVAPLVGCPAIYTPNAFVTMDPTLSTIRRAAYRRIEWLLSIPTSRLIAVSAEEAEHARGLGVAQRKIRVVANGISPPSLPTRDEARDTLGITPEWRVIGFVGRLTPQKAPDQLLHAFSLASRELPAARLAIVGGGPLEEQVRQQASSLGVAEKVLWLGEIPGQSAMPAFDIYCLSSRYEGFPYVLLEALAAGLPIVTTRVGGASAMVEDGVNGRIVPVGAPEPLAQALQETLCDPSILTSFAAASKARAAQFTMDRMVEQTLAVYREVVRPRATV